MGIWLRCSSRHVVSKHGSRIVLDSCITAPQQKDVQETETWSIKSRHFPRWLIGATAHVRFGKAVYQSLSGQLGKLSRYSAPVRDITTSPPWNPPPISSNCACSFHRRHSESSRAGSREQGVSAAGIRRSFTVSQSVPGTPLRLTTFA